MMEERCRTCGGDLKKSAAGFFCARCLYGTAMEELAGKSEAATPDWREMAGFLPQYEFVREIGRGGMGTVYEALDPENGGRLAVKVLAPSCAMNPELVERFRREAEVMETLRHERIVSVKHWGERGGLLHLVMEFVPGGDVAGLLRKNGKLELEAAVELIGQACEGLEFSHSQGILHRDIKPGNLLLDDEGRLKLGDFGLAKVVDEASTMGLTMTNAAMGTPRYMAPEQMSGAETVDERTDVYALGVVFYEMLTGRLPGGNFALPSELVKVGGRVDEVVLKALSESADDRYSSVAEFHKALQGLVKKNGRRQLLVGLGLLLAAAMAIPLMTSRAHLQGEAWVLESKDGGELPQGFPKRLEGVLDLRLSDAQREFGVALMEDGSLHGVGDDSYGQASPPGGNDFIMIAVGRGERAAHGLALTKDGRVVAWGDDSFGQSQVPANLNDVQAIAAGEFSSVARLKDGTLRSWGKAEEDLMLADQVESDPRFGRTVKAWREN